MELQDYLRTLRMRWLTVLLTAVVSTVGGAGFSLLTTPVYAATAELFVTASSGATIGEAYQGGRYSQERVSSYGRLLTREAVAREAIESLGLEMDARELQQRITATSARDTVLIDLTVQDTDPERAALIANTIAANFTEMVAELEAPTDGGVPMARVTVVEEASTPESPILPRTRLNIVLSCVLGLMLGVGLALLRDRMDNTVKDREAIDAVGAKALVGVIPFEKEREKAPAINFSDARSRGAEAYRSLRTNLQFLDVDHPPRVVVVTSGLPGEGKSTTAVNLSAVLAESGKKVLLIEGDLRRPRVARYLGLIESVGLTTVLAGQATIDDVLQPTAFAGLTVLGAGSIPPNPSELLGSQHAHALIEEMRGRFDYVVIDAPPLLPVTDASILTRHSDGALVVARHGHTKRDDLAGSIERLSSVGAPVLGAILTLVPQSSAGQKNDSYYYTSDEDGPKQRGSYPSR